jgi:predicted TIM-barrel fold metal-dependent hydrolase
MRTAMLLAHVVTFSASLVAANETNPRADALSADVWRGERRIIDMHMHIEARPERYQRAIGVMNAAGIGTGIELGSGTVTPNAGGVSDFEKAVSVSQQVCPGRFLHYMILDYSNWDQDDWSQKAVEQINRGRELGAAGLKEFKRLGLTLRDGKGQLIKVDDPKLDPVWKRCGELGMPISIHVGDPKAFWEPLDASNERWAELKDHPDWWFGDSEKYPPRMEILAALERVIERHPQTTFVCVHFANNPEDIEWVDRQLAKHPNMMADVAARLPEIGRHDSTRLRDLFVKHQDRILFGTDFQVWSRMILGSAGDDERPTDQDALIFFLKSYRFFETADRDWVHMTPIQGDWTISSINLPPSVQRKVYFDNARKLLAQSYPAPVMHARRTADAIEPDGQLNEAAWATAPAGRIEYALSDCVAYPDLSTSVRVLWNDDWLYLAYEAPYTELTMADPPQEKERLGLWDDDVVEVFVDSDATNPRAYEEFEWAPNGEQLDVRLNLPDGDFAWQSGMQSTVRIDREAKIWRVEARIPLSAFGDHPPEIGDRWRVNFYRNDAANNVFLAWRPTLSDTAHKPERFGWLEFVE